MRFPTIAPPPFPARLGLAVLLAAFADYLFYGQRLILDVPLGLALPLFGLALLAAMLAANPAARRDRRAAIAAVLGLAGLLPLVENVSALSTLLFLAAFGLAALALSGRLKSGVDGAAKSVAGLALAGPFRLIADLFRWRRAERRLGRKAIRFVGAAGWALPIVLGAVFVILFGMANPVVERWLSAIDLWTWLSRLSPTRLFFWLFVIAAGWIFIKPRLPWFQRRVPKRVKREPAPPRTGHIDDALFGEAAILRALWLFNALFAVETALDIAYLWGGLALPDGMSHADYAHRGAYPLIATALLAALFVLAAMRPGSASAANPTIRVLVYVWTAQNILLVLSSILRLDLYVSAYSLTYWRVTAFIWMALVATGLGLIIARIALDKSNRWLLSANLLALAATLYACAFVNFAGLIADWNVAHSREMGGDGQPLDTCYLLSLGPHALRALDRFVGEARLRLADERANLAATNAFQTGHWRNWSFRAWRLGHYLDRNEPTGHTAPAEKGDDADGARGR